MHTPKWVGDCDQIIIPVIRGQFDPLYSIDTNFQIALADFVNKITFHCPSGKFWDFFTTYKMGLLIK